MKLNVKSVIARFSEIVSRLARTRYVRALEAQLARAEAENSRLRQENRALLNSILGIAGIPPVYTNSAEQPRSVLSTGAGPEAPALGPVPPSTDSPAETGAAQTKPAAAAGHGKNFAPVAAPLRRRSWHQINRALEFEAARKKPQEIANG